MPSYRSTDVQPSKRNFFGLRDRTALCLSTPLSARAEKVWDNDLKRYLTEAELNHAEVFMSEDEAVKVILPKSQRVRKEVIQLDQDKKDLIEQRIGWKFPEQAFEVYIGETGGRSTVTPSSTTPSVSTSI